MGVQGYMGQYGIYVPQYMTKSDPRIDHWQSLKLSSRLFRRFDPANYRNLPTRKDRLAIIDAFLCKDTSCKDGFFIPPQCKKNPKECKELLVGTVSICFRI
jgi:hypothetical protein